MLTRRGILTGLAASLFSAPAIVRAASLMPVKAITPDPLQGWQIVSKDYECVIRLQWMLVEVTDDDRAAVAAAA